MSDIFENDIEQDEDLSLLEDDENTYDSDNFDRQSQQYNLTNGVPLYALRLEYSCENLYAKNDRHFTFNTGDYVIVPTRYGRDAVKVLGVAKRPYGVRQNDILVIERVCDNGDLKQIAENKSIEAEAGDIFREKVRAHNLAMKLVTVHFVIDEPKVLFFFSAETRVDFRELVRDLVSVFKTRIELRQIGVRDEARITGGLGPCGRPFCCHCISDKLHPVTIKMAKDQNLSLNSTKISGVCGRLLCCLAHEDNFYVEARKKLPQEGTRIFYDGTEFKITEINLLTSMAKMYGTDGRMLEVNTKRFSRSGNKWVIENFQGNQYSEESQ